MVVSAVRRGLRHVRDRGLLAAIVLMAVLAALVQSVLWWIEPESKPHDFIGPPRSGYTMRNYHGYIYNKQGQPGVRISGPYLERRDGDDSLFLTSPDFDMPSPRPEVPDWLGHSEYGWINKSGDLIKLQGKVFMHRAAYADNAAAQLHSSNVTGWPRQNKLATDDPARIAQGKSWTAGLGMRANLNTNELELLHDVHASFPPRSPQHAVAEHTHSPAPAAHHHGKRKH